MLGTNYLGQGVPGQDYPVTVAGGSPATVLPGVGALLLAAFAVTVALPVNIRPAVGGVTLTGFAPTVTTPRIVRPLLGALTLTGFVPAATVPRVARPSIGSVTLAGLVPTVTIAAAGGPFTGTPGVGVLALAGLSPLVARGQPTSNTGGIRIGDVRKRHATQSFTAYEPTVRIARAIVSAAPATARPEPGVAGILAFAPTVTASFAERRPVAQLVEQRPLEAPVLGSTPSGATRPVTPVRPPDAPDATVAPPLVAPHVSATQPRPIGLVSTAAVGTPGVGVWATTGFAPMVRVEPVTERNQLTEPTFAPSASWTPDDDITVIAAAYNFLISA